MRASLRGRDELAARVQQALALPTKKEAEHIVDAVIGSLEATLLNNLGAERVHAEAGQLRQVLSPAQAGDSQEDSVHGRDDTDEGQTEGQVRQLGGIAAVRTSSPKMTPAGVSSRPVSLWHVAQQASTYSRPNAAIWRNRKTGRPPTPDCSVCNAKSPAGLRGTQPR